MVRLPLRSCPSSLRSGRARAPMARHMLSLAGARSAPTTLLATVDSGSETACSSCDSCVLSASVSAPYSSKPDASVVLRYLSSWVSRAVNAVEIVLVSAGSIFVRPGCRHANACSAPSTLACEVEQVDVRVTLFLAGDLGLARPRRAGRRRRWPARPAGTSDRSSASAASRRWRAGRRRTCRGRPGCCAWNRPFSMRWKPSHCAAGTSSARASMSPSRLSVPLVNDSATGSMRS